MSTPAPLTPDEIERLLADLDAGLYDEELAADRDGSSEAQPQRFSELKEFDVKA